MTAWWRDVDDYDDRYASDPFFTNAIPLPLILLLLILFFEEMTHGYIYLSRDMWRDDIRWPTPETSKPFRHVVCVLCIEEVVVTCILTGILLHYWCHYWYHGYQDGDWALPPTVMTVLQYCMLNNYMNHTHYQMEIPCSGGWYSHIMPLWWFVEAVTLLPVAVRACL